MKDNSQLGIVIIVEDEPLIAADLANQLRKSNYDVLDIFESGEETIAYLNDHNEVDLIIMDVQLQGAMDGVDTAQYIHSKYEIPVIFLTSNTDQRTFQRAKIAFPHAFLSKPFRTSDILHAMGLALEKSSQSVDDNVEFMPDRIFIKTNQSLERVLYKEILYFEADGSYTNLVTDQKTFLLSQTLKKTEQSLSGDNFIKVHRSYVVNIENVKRITDGDIYVNERKIPVSRAKRDTLVKLFKTL